MERCIPILTSVLFWAYAANACILVLHEIESAYWQEWKLFRLKGGITGFLIAHIPMTAIVFWGLIETFRGSIAGMFLSLLLAAAGIFAFFIHRHFIIAGKKGFSLPVSRALLRTTLVLSVIEVVIAVPLLLAAIPAAAVVVKMLSIAGLSVITMWGAVPYGIAIGVHPVMVAILTAAGAAIPTAAVVFGGTKIREKLLGRKRRKKRGVLMRIWHRYGVIGIGILAPWITGAPIGAALAVTLKSEPRRTFLWMTAGILLCAATLSVLGAFGIAALQHR